MDVNELIAKIELRSKQYAEDHHVRRDDDWFLLKIQEEFGELTQKYLMLTDRARQKEMSKEEIRKDLEYEFADLFCQTILFGEHNNIDLLKNVQEKWLKHLR